MDDYKRCVKCDKVKVTSEFRIITVNNDGLCGLCKKCEATYSKWWKKNKGLTYRTWECMRSRCNNLNRTAYKDYGGRGITICKRWDKFENFFEDMGGKPKGLTIERIDNDKGYYKENCKWATKKEQSRNSRRNRMVAYQGKTQCIQDWAVEVSIHPETLRKRLNKYPPEKAFTLGMYEYEGRGKRQR